MAQYDVISKDYNTYSSNHPWCSKIFFPSLARMLGDIKNKKVLDLACGDGAPTRWIKSLGASKVVGVDISQGMIDEARERVNTSNSSLSIQYIVSDAKVLDKIDEFDIVTAFYLLNYASTKEELLTMCQQILLNMKKGGKFVGVTPYVNERKYFHVPEKHGFRLSVPSNDLQDGDLVTGTTKLTSTTFSATWFYHSQETYSWAFRTAGFEHFEWRRLEMGESPSAADVEFYKEIVDHPFDMGIVAW